MSYAIGLDAINLRPAQRLAHTEYCSHAALKRHVAPNTEPAELDRAFRDGWDIDFVWSTNDGPIDWATAGRTTDMGHAQYLEGGVDMRMPKVCPFNTPEEVWAFDAVEEYGLPDFDDLIVHYRQTHAQRQAAFPNQVYPGGYYKTIVSGAIDAFGWDMLLEAASDLKRFARVLDSFYRRTLYHVRAWAQTPIEAFIQHDDFVWTQGPFMDPGFYRSEIIPRYAELWKALHAGGKRVLFCSDADWSIFLDEIAAAGADGFIFEPVVPLERVVRDYGRTHVIMGSAVDCRTMTFGTPAQIRAEIDRTMPLAMSCPGFMFAVGNHIPSNVPIENATAYIEHLRSQWYRR